jgi:hypothetical protein
MEDNEVELHIITYDYKPKKPSILESLWYALSYTPRGKYSFKTLYSGRRKGQLFIEWKVKGIVVHDETDLLVRETKCK